MFFLHGAIVVDPVGRFVWSPKS